MTTSASRQAGDKARAAPLPVQADASQVPGEPANAPHRELMIAEAAYYIAEARGFSPSQALDDWLAAEREIEQRLSNPGH